VGLSSAGVKGPLTAGLPPVVVAHSIHYRRWLWGAVMTRPNQDRTRIEVWVKRSSLAWLNKQAKREGKSRSALVRDLLVEAITARQGHA
jgi:hypothetical protein